jgi:ribokinase
MGRVVVLGSLNVDLVTRVPRHPAPGETVLGEGLERLAGGKGANQAVAAAEAGAEVLFVGCVGRDADGRAYRERLRRRGVDVTRLLDVDAPTGHALITVADGGESVIVVVPGANACIQPEAVERLPVGPDDVLLTQLEVPLDAVAAAVRRAADRGARVVLNLAPYAVLPPDVVATADPLVANEHEARLLADGEAIPSSLRVTFGPHDTTGAGDAFCGALAAALAGGAGRVRALDRAVAAGAEAVCRHGAQRDPYL